MKKIKARILDIDGTLADVSSVLHYIVGQPEGAKDFDSFHSAAEFVPANTQALDYAIETAALGMVPIVVTARMESHYASTKRFLDRVMPVAYDGPIMRPQGDVRRDVVIKLDILRYLRRTYDIRGAIDDNPAVVELWSEAGIPVEVVPGFDTVGSPGHCANGKVKAPAL